MGWVKLENNPIGIIYSSSIKVQVAAERLEPLAQLNVKQRRVLKGHASKVFGILNKIY
jgi:hypothetical protein